MSKLLNLIYVLLMLLFILSPNLLAQKTYRVLSIGNSFSEDALGEYLNDIAINDEGVNLVIGIAVIGSASLKTHWLNSISDTKSYTYITIKNSKKVFNKNKSLNECLKDEEWDIISLQQVSFEAGKYDTFFPFITDLVKYIKQTASNPNIKIALHQTWAYQEDKVDNKYNFSQLTMYNDIVKTISNVSKIAEIDIVVPVGTAIQNGRSSYIGDNFNRDGVHLNNTIGKYTAACVWYQSITGRLPFNFKFKPIGMTNSEAIIAKYASFFSHLNPTSISCLKCLPDIENCVDINLKIIDKTKGEKLKSFYSLDESDVFFKLSQDLLPYSFSDSMSLKLNQMKTTKNDTAWIIEKTIKAPQGEHYWIPFRSNPQDVPLNKRHFFYGESDSLHFRINKDGSISGITKLTITLDYYPVLLQVIDKNFGVWNNIEDKTRDGKMYIQGYTPNNIDYVMTDLTNEFIYKKANNDIYLPMFPDIGNEIQKNDTAWIWSAYVYVSSGSYSWKPFVLNDSLKVINSPVYYSNFNSGFQRDIIFYVNLNGQITGETSVIVPNISSNMRNQIIQEEMYCYYENRQIHIKNPLNLQLKITVYNLTGSIVEIFNTSDNQITHSINYNKGVYLMKIHNNRLGDIKKKFRIE